MNRATDQQPAPAVMAAGLRCTGCLYYENDGQTGLDHCFRFARFVDHVINQSTEDCDYRS